ncbi:MAG TPA: GntR family transcriptional regulator [Lichenihabitans sp.]|jgi:DNA-binding GntR family transcriptional regulator|nr:GntR family transcriptional regulator [Lichenihabitans sp.]
MVSVRAASRRVNAETGFLVQRIAPEASFKSKAYAALKDAILRMDIYASSEPMMLDERALSDRLGISRTPIREAVAMLEQDGFLRTVPRRGILVVKKTKVEVVEMIQAWAALEAMAARLITQVASIEDISALRNFFAGFSPDHPPETDIQVYSDANIAFHQSLISLSGSQVLVDMTDSILMHVRGFRKLTIGRQERISRSLPEHYAMIGALESRDTEQAEKLARDHTLGLAAYVNAHGHELFD